MHFPEGCPTRNSHHARMGQMRSNNAFYRSKQINDQEPHIQHPTLILHLSQDENIKKKKFRLDLCKEWTRITNCWNTVTASSLEIPYASHMRLDDLVFFQATYLLILVRGIPADYILKPEDVH